MFITRLDFFFSLLKDARHVNLYDPLYDFSIQKYSGINGRYFSAEELGQVKSSKPDDFEYKITCSGTTRYSK